MYQFAHSFFSGNETAFVPVPFRVVIIKGKRSGRGTEKRKVRERERY